MHNHFCKNLAAFMVAGMSLWPASSEGYAIIQNNSFSTSVCVKPIENESSETPDSDHLLYTSRIYTFQDAPTFYLDAQTVKRGEGLERLGMWGLKNNGKWGRHESGFPSAGYTQKHSLDSSVKRIVATNSGRKIFALNDGEAEFQPIISTDKERFYYDNPIYIPRHKVTLVNSSEGVFFLNNLTLTRAFTAPIYDKLSIKADLPENLGYLGMLYNKKNTFDRTKPYLYFIGDNQDLIPLLKLSHKDYITNVVELPSLHKIYIETQHGGIEIDIKPTSGKPNLSARYIDGPFSRNAYSKLIKTKNSALYLRSESGFHLFDRVPLKIATADGLKSVKNYPAELGPSPHITSIPEWDMYFFREDHNIFYLKNDTVVPFKMDKIGKYASFEYYPSADRTIVKSSNGVFELTKSYDLMPLSSEELSTALAFGDHMLLFIMKDHKTYISPSAGKIFSATKPIKGNYFHSLPSGEILFLNGTHAYKISNDPTCSGGELY